MAGWFQLTLSEISQFQDKEKDMEKESCSTHESQEAEKQQESDSKRYTLKCMPPNSEPPPPNGPYFLIPHWAMKM